ncbi:MAG: hypothetical protein OXG62_07625 [Nitrospinae bacterium]|nr:hypothetical protein [Nitrospinota bacterium]
MNQIKCTILNDRLVIYDEYSVAQSFQYYPSESQMKQVFEGLMECREKQADLKGNLKKLGADASKLSN